MASGKTNYLRTGQPIRPNAVICDLTVAISGEKVICCRITCAEERLRNHPRKPIRITLIPTTESEQQPCLSSSSKLSSLLDDTVYSVLYSASCYCYPPRPRAQLCPQQNRDPWTRLDYRVAVVGRTGSFTRP